MSTRNPFRYRGISRLASGVLILLAFSFTGAYAGQQQEQQQSQTQEATQSQQNGQPQPNPPPPEQPQPKQRKVWTNDDVVSLRTPADTYQVEKEAQKAADAAAAAKKEAIRKKIKDAGLTLDLPPTTEETQRLIRTKQDQIADLQVGIDRLNKDLPGAAADQKPEMEIQIEKFKGYLEKAELELQVLQDHLKDLTDAKPAAPPAVPPPATPPPPQNPL